MFCLNESIRYYLFPYPTDMRKGFYTLSGIVKNLMGMDVCDGDAYIFLNRPLNTMKILHMETGGLVIYHMKLEEGYFTLPDYDTTSNHQKYPASWSDLVLMIQGVNSSKYHRQKRWNPKEKKP